MKHPVQHKMRHVLLHRHLDELVADWIEHNHEVRPSRSTVLDLMTWAHKQTQEPTPSPED